MKFNNLATHLVVIITAFTSISCAPRLIGVKAKLAAALAAAAAAGGTSGFGLSATGTRGFQSAVGDFNHNGSLDIVFSDPTSNAVDVALGNGAGAFAAAVSYAVSGVPIGIAVSDINHDGNLDLFVTTASGNIDILLGTAVGTFGAFTSYAGGSANAGIVAADFNKNGVTDVVFTIFDTNQIGIKTGLVAGTLNGATATIAVGTNPAGIAMADFDHNGNMDVVVANTGSSNVSVLLGNGAASFAAAVNYAVGTNPVGVVTGDFNRDGNADVAVSNYGTNNVSVLLGNGAGALGAAVNYNVGTGPVGIAAGDFDSDGDLDLVTANNGSTNVSVILGNGLGAFAAATNTAMTAAPLCPVVGDYQKHSVVDAAISKADTTPQQVAGTIPVGVTGVFSAMTTYATSAGSGVAFIRSADVDNDGDMDIIDSESLTDNVQVWLNNGAGAFAAGPIYVPGAGCMPMGMNFGDFNRDGWIDFAVACRNSGDANIYLNNGNGTFTIGSNMPIIGAGGNAWDVYCADFDNDGDLDCAVAGDSFAGGGIVEVYTNNGAGVFAYGASYSTPLVGDSDDRSIAGADIDRDGDIDLLVSCRNSQKYGVLVNTGAGAFAAMTTAAAGGSIGYITPFDYDIDGDIDVLVAGDSVNNEFSLFAGSGATNFAAGVLYNATGGAAYGELTPVDWDFDGDYDISAASFGLNGISLMRNDGAGVFTELASISTLVCLGTSGITKADFNRDGKPDLFVTCYNNDFVGIVFGN